MFSVELYNTNFEKIAMLDVFASFIWTIRYSTCGEFELSLDPNSKEFKMIGSDYYLRLVKDENIDEEKSHFMIIEDIKSTFDSEMGYSNLITGRSLESLLDRRIVWEPTWYAGPLQEGIRLLLEKNMINPKDSNRKIDNIVFIPSNDEYINSIGIEINELGRSLLEVISEICDMYMIGYRMRYNFVTNNIEFELYKGENRTLKNPKDNLVIEFSEKNENLLNSNFVNSASSYKNTILISGEGKDDKMYFSSYNNTNFGINRKETYLKSDLEFKLEDEDKLSIPEYERQLKEEGKNVLQKIEKVTSFDGECSATNTTDLFKFNKDFYLGDLCYVSNEYGIESSVIITEIVETYDESGYSFNPGFVAIEWKPSEVTGTIYIDSENKVFEIKGITKPIDIDWGDGKKETNLTGDISHTYTGKEAVYRKTEGTTIVEGKNYYTRTGTEGSYVYTKVENPVVEDIGNYYEMFAPSEYEGLYDFKLHRSDNYDMDFCPKFTGSKVLYDIQVPNGISELEEQTFYDCTMLHEVILPNSLKKFKGENMFYNCTNLNVLSLPNSIEEMPSNTFNNCTNLYAINIPYNTKIINTNLIVNAGKLKEISFPGNTFSDIGVETINGTVLNNCPKINNVNFGSKVKTIANNFLTGVSGADNKVSITSLNYTPPTLSGQFNFQVNGIEVPNSPKWDDSVVNAYRNAPYWTNYKYDIKEKDGKPLENPASSEYEYAENSSRTKPSSGGQRIPEIDAQISEQNSSS